MSVRNHQFSVRTAVVLLLMVMLLALGGAALAQDNEPQHIPERAAMLPVIMQQGSYTGEIKFSSPRFAGVTTFIPQLVLDFTDLKPYGNPVEMKIWHQDENARQVPWVPIAPTYTKDFKAKKNGIQTMSVAFRSLNGYLQGYQVPFFFIPGGDFGVPDRDALAKLGWMLTEGGLPYYVENDALRLNSEFWGCNNLPYNTFAAGQLDLSLPEHGDYHLRVDATVITYDQLPDPTDDKYDAFEVYLGYKLLGRYGNPDEPLGCGIEWRIDLDTAYDLQPYGKSRTFLRFENHNRFDEFYNTYTDVHQVWVDEGDPPASTTTSTGQKLGLDQLRPEDVGVVGPVRRD